jgi:hypothetical protein
MIENRYRDLANTKQECQTLSRKFLLQRFCAVGTGSLNSVLKVKVSRYTPWRRLGGEEV